MHNLIKEERYLSYAALQKSVQVCESVLRGQEETGGDRDTVLLHKTVCAVATVMNLSPHEIGTILKFKVCNQTETILILDWHLSVFNSIVCGTEKLEETKLGKEI